MTSIKPPDTGLPATTTAPAESSPAGATREARESQAASFQQAVRDAQAGQANAGVAAAGQAAADPIAALSRQIQAGTLSVDQAVERLIERAGQGVARHLGERERSELTALLRSALANDPTLAALRDDLR
jgi:anti-sigma28 factor (negative regulator of flagellin synthesis)